MCPSERQRVWVGDKSKLLLKRTDTHHPELLKSQAVTLGRSGALWHCPQRTELSSNSSPSGFMLGMPPASPLFCLFKLVGKIGKEIWRDGKIFLKVSENWIFILAKKRRKRRGSGRRCYYFKVLRSTLHHLLGLRLYMVRSYK